MAVLQFISNPLVGYVPQDSTLVAGVLILLVAVYAKVVAEENRRFGMRRQRLPHRSSPVSPSTASSSPPSDPKTLESA